VRGSILSLIAALLAVALIGLASLIVVVYAPQLDSKDSVIADQSQQIAHLNATIADLNGQISDLQGQLSSIREKYTANIVTALGAKDISSNDSTPRHFYITGTVTNTGVTAAYNAGLHITGYGPTHEVLINMTSALDSSVIYQTGFSTPGQLSTVYPTQSLGVVIAIYHSGTVVDYEITPVWVNPP